MPLPSYLQTSEIHAQLRSLGHDVSENEVAQLLMKLGFGEEGEPESRVKAECGAAEGGVDARQPPLDMPKVGAGG